MSESRDESAAPAAVDRRNLTFLQAEGQVSLPRQLALREVSAELTAKLWDVYYTELLRTKRQLDYSKDRLGSAWTAILRDWFVHHEHGFADEFSHVLEDWLAPLKAKFVRRNYLEIFEFVQFTIRHPEAPYNFEGRVANALSQSRAAYFVDGTTIFPKASVEEGAALQAALIVLRGSEYGGARAHLSAAANLLSEGDYGGSVRESVSAVESIARSIEPSADKLSTALAKLHNGKRIHQGLKAAFNSLYGYASDEEGVRHALVFQDQPHVGEAEAIFMIGACASFVTFVIGKGSLIG
jgi:hypothetical protein